MPRKRARPHVLCVFVIALLTLVGGLAAAAAPPAAALSSTVVISQVFGGGGNSGAPYRNDFVELFNRGATTVSLSGWSIQYASATGAGTFAMNSVTSLSGSLEPGQYYLVQLASGGDNGDHLPTPDVVGAVNMAAAGGKVILANTTAGLACNGGSVPCTAAQLAMIVDLIGWGSANFFEGAVGPATSTTTAALRGRGGYTETDNNAADFSVGAPNPRNTASPLNLTPSITVQPIDQTVNDGQQATFSAAATGSPAPTVKWQVSVDGGTVWEDVAGATSTSLSFTAATPQTGNRYRAVFTNIAATVTSNAVTLTVNPPALVISQVYGGGGNTGATLRNDFIELFNRGTTTVSLAGWSIQYAATTGVNWSRTDLSGTIAPGHYYLIQEARGAGGTTDLPSPDASGSIAMHHVAGKVVLIASQKTIPSGTVRPSGPLIVDLVGYGAGTDCFEGTGPAPSLSNTTAALRDGAGWVDTDDNSADFQAGEPSPRNTAYPANPGLPLVSVSAPTGGETLTGASTIINGHASDPGGSVVGVSVSIQRSSDGSYWTGSAWDPTQAWLAATGTASWTCSWAFEPASQDGSPSYTIVARATDNMGNTSTASITGVMVDNTPPTGVSLLIDGGAPYANNPAVSLTLSASGAAEMRLRNEDGAWSAWEPYVTSRSWTLSAGDGAKIVEVQFRDAAGNTVTARHFITLDTVPPTSVSLLIDGGAPYANNPAVSLTLSASGATEMRLRNEDGAWSAWEPYAPSRSWTLSAGDGAKVVEVQFRDAAGNVAAAGDTVFFDSKRPTPTGTKAVSVRRGAKATLRFRINDPTPSSGSATVKIVVRTMRGKSVKSVTLKNRPVGTVLKYRFVCKLRKGSYRYVIHATDAAGNTQTRVARNILRVR